METTVNQKSGQITGQKSGKSSAAPWIAVLLLTFAITALTPLAFAQDRDQQGHDQDDPPDRVARLGYMEGSVSFRPAGETEWVQAASNRPMTTGDQLWADRDSRAELQLGSAVIRIGANTGFSFLNLDDRTAQLQLTSGSLNISVRRLDRDDVFEIDTPNQAFSIFQTGSYRVEASEDGTYTVVSVRQGEGESTGNGQNFTVHAGQRATFSGSDTLRADVVQIAGPDDFDNWAYNREHRHESSRSAQYVSRDVVGYDDLDDNGDWRDDRQYGHVWYPNRVGADWAPYREGHWDWIAPWGWTWVDDSSWGYAPFHYGRWVTVNNRWGWVAGPVTVRAVYAPALVVFLGAGGGGFGGNVGWFPLGPREVYVPSYHVSRDYVNRVNVSNTTVTTTNITNVYNTTIVNNNTTNITNVNYVNRNARGAVTAVPQHAFASAQPVNRSAVAINARDIASAPVSARVAVAPTQQSVMGARANTANRVAAPPAAVANRQVIAKTPPPPPPVSFAKQEQALAKNPGQPLARREVQSLRPADAPAAHRQVKQAPPGKPATPNQGPPPANAGNGAKPGQPTPPNGGQPPQNAARPGNQSGNQPGNQPGNPAANNPAPANHPNQPAQPANPANASRPERPGQNQPENPAANRPANPPPANTPPAKQEPADQPGNTRQQNERPADARPGNDRPTPDRPNAGRPNADRPNNERPNIDRPNNDRPAATSPAPVNRPGAQPQPSNRPDDNRPQPNRPDANRPEPNREAPPARNDNPPKAAQPPANGRSQPNRPQNDRPQADRPQPDRPQNDRPQADRPRSDRPPAQADRPPTDRPQADRPPNDRPKNAPAANKPMTPEEKKRLEEEQKKRLEEERKRPPGA